MAAVPPRSREAFLTHWHDRVLGDASASKQSILCDGEVAGWIGSWWDQGQRLVGYWLGPAFWGRGLATAALAEFLAEHEQRRPLCAWVWVENVASLRVLEKCGFHRVGEPIPGADGVSEWSMRLER
jgi:RimJ/RimL family protein N-acetyltransferase